MSRANKTQKYAVLWLDSQGKSAEEISSELDLTNKQVTSILQTKNGSNSIKTKSQPVASSPSKNLMIRETANKNKHVAIMTREASMINDDAKKTSTSKKSQTGIFKINKNDE